MNCDDISQWLDERELADLSAEKLAELEAHVSRCAECARQCLASEQMKSFRTDVPPMPASLHERARQLRELCESTTSPQKTTRRPVIFGSLLLLGAAATMPAAISWRDTRTAHQ
jgi:anti-sigma factor RsiW